VTLLARWLPLPLLLSGCVLQGTAEFSANAERESPTRSGQDGRTLYQNNCATCHAPDGRGRPRDQVGFDYPLPDFTDCSYNSREQSPDWVAIAHQGGPIRGFTPIMPAFGDALTTAELSRLVEYIRAFCTDRNWPRGELNFPAAQITEKAFPEDEALIKTAIGSGSTRGAETTFIVEKRLGSHSQLELSIPWLQVDIGPPGHWEQGVGDVAVAFKHVLGHSLDRGYIVSAAAELALPTGDADRGLGSGTSSLETFVAGGFQLPADFFLQTRAIYTMPFDGAAREAALHMAFGNMRTQGPFGRQWNPMVELVGARTLTSGAHAEWDWVPQLQVSINQRQHLLFNVGVRLPLTQRAGRDPQYLAYLLWDWYDGGLLDGW